MKRYTVTLEQSEREALEGITRKGAHRPQKVINALVLLNCDEGAFNERRSTGAALAEVLGNYIQTLTAWARISSMREWVGRSRFRCFAFYGSHSNLWSAA